MRQEEIDAIKGGYDVVDAYPPRIDGNKVRFWALKKDAVAAAKGIGFPKSSVTEIYTRFCGGFAIANGDGFLSREEYGKLENPYGPFPTSP